jgi:hypothetical protein
MPVRFLNRFQFLYELCLLALAHLHQYGDDQHRAPSPVRVPGGALARTRPKIPGLNCSIASTGRSNKKHKNRHRVIDLPPSIFAPARVRYGPGSVRSLLTTCGEGGAAHHQAHADGSGPAVMLLALHAQMLITGDLDPTPESALSAENNASALWQMGSYTPGPAYPQTFEETLQELRNGPKTKEYYSSFQPFVPSMKDPPRGLGEVSGGIVKHHETNLWQIWMMFAVQFTFLGAYLDHEKAQSKLEDIINAIRRERHSPRGKRCTGRCGQSQKANPGNCRTIGRSTSSSTYCVSRSHCNGADMFANRDA